MGPGGPHCAHICIYTCSHISAHTVPEQALTSMCWTEQHRRLTIKIAGRACYPVMSRAGLTF